MKKFFVLGIISFLFAGNLSAQDHSGQRPPQSSADRAKKTIERLSESIKFSEKQKSEMTTIFTKFYDDSKAQQAFHDPEKMKPLEKERDGKVEKLLNDKKLFKQYQDAMAEMKAQWQQRREQQPPKK
jgi:hypothetical protein